MTASLSFFLLLRIFVLASCSRLLLLLCGWPPVQIKNGSVRTSQALVRLCTGKKKPSDPNGVAAEARQSIVSNEKMSGSSLFGIVQQQGQFTPCVGSGLNTHVVSCCCALSPSLPPPLPVGLARCGFRSAKVLLCPQLCT